MPRPALEVADILRRHGPAYRHRHRTRMTATMVKVMRAIELCRTAALGGHLRICDRCGSQDQSYNSCRNRHCPRCQGPARAKWLEARRQELLPVSYFHLVFTLPACLSGLALHNKRIVYGILFRSVAKTLRTIARDPKHLGADIGFFAVLHTWGQQLQHHPHIHAVVPGGGLSPDRSRWIHRKPVRRRKRRRRPFFLPVRVLSRHFRRLFLDDLLRAFASGQLQFPSSISNLETPAAFHQLISQARDTDWVVYAKKPFGGPDNVLRYLSRYTHRVAISNHRLLSLDDDRVSFQWHDYRTGRSQPMTLPAHDFIRRFLLHVLPDGFVRIRHFGLFANRHRAQNLALCRQLLGPTDPPPPPPPPDNATDPLLCPVCRKGHLVIVGPLHATTDTSHPTSSNRAPP